MPITDELGLPLAEARDRFAGLTTLAIPEPEALAATHDKSATFAMAERLGIAVPATRVVEVGTDAADVGSELGFPVVVKPIASREVLADRTIGRTSFRTPRMPRDCGPMAALAGRNDGHAPASGCRVTASASSC